MGIICGNTGLGFQKTCVETIVHESVLSNVICPGEGSLHVAKFLVNFSRNVSGEVFVDQRRSLSHGLNGIEHHRQFLIVDSDECECLLGGIPIHGCDCGDLIADVSDLVGAKDGFIVSRGTHTVLDRASVLVGDNGFHPRKVLSL